MAKYNGNIDVTISFVTADDGATADGPDLLAEDVSGFLRSTLSLASKGNLFTQECEPDSPAVYKRVDIAPLKDVVVDSIHTDSDLEEAEEAHVYAVSFTLTRTQVYTGTVTVRADDDDEARDYVENLDYALADDLCDYDWDTNETQLQVEDSDERGDEVIPDYDVNE